MLVTLIIILLLIWAAVIWSIYSNFVVFYSNFFETENYHKAYYASIAALERWELVTRQRQPWYVWSGGFILWNWTWEYRDSLGNLINNNWWSDWSLQWFSYLWDNANVSSVFRTVNSKTNRIPATWNWDIERMLSADDSQDYNTMWFENSEVFLLYYDTSIGNPYDSWVFIALSHPQSITWEIRLPGLLNSSSWWYWDLDTENSLIWKEWELPNDDAIVDRQIRGNRGWNPFTVYSTQNTSRSKIEYEHDSIFRESDINAPLTFVFWNIPGSASRWDTISSNSSMSNAHWDRADITVISQDEATIKTLHFQDIFNNPDTSLRLSLLNLLKTTNSGQYYPFLEYYADFWTDVADKYYTIDAEWSYKDYQVNTIIQKPTVKETVLGNFTSIF